MKERVEDALRRLHEFVSGEEFAEELRKGKEEFFRMVTPPLPGEVIEEPRLASFVEWFLFDRQLTTVPRTPLEEYLRRNAEIFSAEERELFVGFTRAVHSLFLVKSRKESAELYDLYSRRKYHRVKRVPISLGPGDLAELRLLPAAGEWFATDALCYHPPVARKTTEKMLRQAAGKGERIDDILVKLMIMNTRYERYPKTAKKTAYDPPSPGK